MIPQLRALRFLVLTFLAGTITAALSAADVRVYIKFNPGQKAAAQAAVAQGGGRVHHQFDNLNAMAVALPEQARAGLERNPSVALIEDDPIREFLAQQIPYGINMVQAPATWATSTGANVKIGVIDSGVSVSHEDLAGLPITGEPDQGATNQRTWYRDELSHGTHVVGTIVAAQNSVGVVGVSPAVSIHMVKVFGDTGNWVYSSDLVAAANAAKAAGSKIISMSLGGSFSSSVEQAGFNQLYNEGVLLVAAAGNGGNGSFSYPASYSSVISVAAINSAEQVASFSQKNSQVELAAPGVAVLSTVSYGTTSVVAGGNSYSANDIEYSARTNVTAQLVYGGLGTTAGSWHGKVVLLDRGTNSFDEKVRNVVAGGGVAAVIANNVDGNFSGTLGAGNGSSIPAVSVSKADGLALRGAVNTSVTVNNSTTSTTGYDYFDGTSMATPHVAGVAALVWSKYPSLSNAQLRQTLANTAKDLGTTGRDNSYGYGLVQAKAALDSLAAAGGGGGGGGSGGGGNDGGTVEPAPLKIESGPSVIVKNAKNGQFEIVWVTNYPATSDVFIDGRWYPDSTLTTNHKRGFRGSKGQTYTYVVRSTDGLNRTVDAGETFTLP